MQMRDPRYARTPEALAFDAMHDAYDEAWKRHAEAMKPFREAMMEITRPAWLL